MLQAHIRAQVIKRRTTAESEVINYDQEELQVSMRGMMSYEYMNAALLGMFSVLIGSMAAECQNGKARANFAFLANHHGAHDRPIQSTLPFASNGPDHT